MREGVIPGLGWWTIKPNIGLVTWEERTRTIDKINLWCKNNIGARGVDWELYGDTYRFKSIDHRALFSLTWC